MQQLRKTSPHALLFLLFLFCCGVFAWREVRAESLSGGLSLKELLSLQVYTPSKGDQQVDRATAAITVITEEDIKRSGARTLYDVLKRVPGFFPSSQATWMLSANSRGLTSDGNDHVLLLVDGHVQNSIVGQGYQQQDMLPILEKVKRIEIVRGPGSVLWGSSAVFGIINIITKDGLDGADHQVTSSYSYQDGMYSVNALQSLEHDYLDISGIVSFSYWQSDGFSRRGRTSDREAWLPEEVPGTKANVEFPWGIVGDWPPLDQHSEGWEAYAKVNLGGEHQVLARVVESRVNYPWDTWMRAAGSELSMRKAYLSYRHAKDFRDFFTLHTTLYGDLLLQNRFPRHDELFRRGGEKRERMQDQSFEERAFGAELTGYVDVTDNNNLTLGLKAVRTYIGPNRDTRFDIAENRPSSTDYPYLGIESGYDNVLAAYLEHAAHFNDRRTTLFGGGRVEHNDFRDDSTIFLPRGGVIHALTERLTAKYIYNTGYLRPNAAYSKGAAVIIDETRGPKQDILQVDRSEKIQNHEAQLFWRRGLDYVALNLSYMLIDNFISFDANNVPMGYKNLGKATSTSAEIEGRYRLAAWLEAYANYAYAVAELDSDDHRGALSNDRNETLNYPHHVYNIGCDIWLNKTTTLNLHVNGWRDMNMIKPLNEEGTGGEFDRLGGSAYLDVNFRADNLFNSGFDLSLFCMNVFDNTRPVGMIVNNGVWYPRGRNIGVSLAYKW